MGEKSLITEQIIRHYNVKGDEYYKGIPREEFLLLKPFSTCSAFYSF